MNQDRISIEPHTFLVLFFRRAEGFALFLPSFPQADRVQPQKIPFGKRIPPDTFKTEGVCTGCQDIPSQVVIFDHDSFIVKIHRPFGIPIGITFKLCQILSVEKDAVDPVIRRFGESQDQSPVQSYLFCSSSFPPEVLAVPIMPPCPVR
jgi:hypothetical protein